MYTSKTTYEAGAILVDSWGSEQTNVDFYAILKRSGLNVTIQKMKVATEYDPQAMTGKNTPTELDATAKPMRKKIQVFNGEESGFTLRNYSGGGWCSLWNGKVKASSHYA